MSLPQEIKDICRIAAAKFPTDIPAAVNHAEQLARDLPNFKSFVKELVRNSLQEGVYDARHVSNTEIKNDTGYYKGIKPKVDVANSPSVQNVHRSVYDMHIAGNILGDIKFSEIDDIAGHEEGKAEGLLFNARLLRWCKQQASTRDVVAGKRIRDVIGERPLRLAYDKILAQKKPDEEAN